MSKKSSPKIVGGDFRGRSIEVPPGLTVRPMRTRVRESLFAHLGDLVEGAAVVDIFAGSGAIGLEALSRGATFCTFIETDSRVMNVLQSNIDALRVRPRTEIVARDAYALAADDFEKSRLVFLDPPFPDFATRAEDIWALARTAIGAGDVERLSIEHPSQVEPPTPPENARVALARQYGDTALLVWESGHA